MRRKLLAVTVFFLLVWCDAREKQLPYAVSGDTAVGGTEDSLVLEFSFINKTDSEVTEFTLAFYVFDEEGNSPVPGNANLAVTVEGPVGAGVTLEDCIDLSPFLSYVPEEGCSVDCLFVRKIRYADGTEWSDPFGMKSF